LSSAVEADEISVIEPTQPLRLLDNPKTIERLGLLSRPLFAEEIFEDDLFKKPNPENLSNKTK